MNFELEENEMRIFSEDEAMLSCSVGSDLSRQNDNPLAIPPCQNGNPLESPSGQGKGARMSFREKLKRFTSPNSGRKTNSSTSSNASEQHSLKDKLVSQFTTIRNLVHLHTRCGHFQVLN